LRSTDLLLLGAAAQVAVPPRTPAIANPYRPYFTLRRKKTP
jgi:hypothetical protein